MATRRIAGVAAGLSDFFGIDVTLIRALFILSAIFTGGAGPLIYLVLWMVVPRSSSGPFSSAAPPPRRSLGWVIVVAALIMGAAVTAYDHRSWIIAIVVVLIGFSLWRKLRGRHSWKTRKEFEAARLAWQRRMDQQATQATQTPNPGQDPFHIGSFYPQAPPDGTYPPSGYGTGAGYGNGYGSGTVYGNGTAYGSGSPYGTGTGYGTGAGYGSASTYGPGSPYETGSTAPTPDADPTDPTNPTNPTNPHNPDSGFQIQ